jgi:hypothetical protein
VHIYQKKIRYLGHIISQDGIAVDPEKIEAIREWSAPKNVIEVRSFMGLVGYYRIFIKGFSKIAHPITSLQKKGVKFNWTLDCEKIFQHLKQLLTSAPILRIANPNEDFIVCIDSCKEGLGGVISQNGFVICYESRKLNKHERHYATHDLELTAIVHALRKWRHYLMGKSFEIRTNHNGMKYLIDQPTLNARQSKWLEFLSEYDFDIKHIKGKENKVSDALSRRVHELHVTTISMYQSYLKDIIIEATKSDLKYKELVEKLQGGNLQQKIEEYKLDNDENLICRGKIYVPNSHELENLILREIHNIPYVGHPRYQKAIAAVRSQYYWPGMKKEVADFISKCLECQKVNDEHRKPIGLLQTLPILEWK